MGRPSRLDEQRRRLLPRIAMAFGELGYRRATTAKLAARCKVKEMILYRLWKDKREMFLRSLETLFDRRREELEQAIRESSVRGSRARKLIAYASQHYDDRGLARAVFAGLAETDDPDIRNALADMYRNYEAYLAGMIREHRARSGSSAKDQARAIALGMMGAVTILNVYGELGIVAPRHRAAFYRSTLSVLGPLFLGESH